MKQNKIKKRCEKCGKEYNHVVYFKGRILCRLCVLFESIRMPLIRIPYEPKKVVGEPLKTQKKGISKDNTDLKHLIPKGLGEEYYDFL